MKVSQFFTFLNAKLKLPLNFNLAVENNFIFQSWEEEAVLFSWNCPFQLELPLQLELSGSAQNCAFQP